MNRKRYQELEEENKELLEKNKILQDDYNNLITNNSNASLIFTVILSIVLLASAFNILSKQENFNFINLSLFIVPNIIELVNMPNQHKIINISRWILIAILCSVYFLLLGATFGNYVIDTGNAFAVPDTVLAFKGFSIYKEKLSTLVLVNIFVPFLSYAAKYKKSNKKFVNQAIEAYTAVTMKGGEQENA